MEHFKNCLTIHLYRKDEALASIRWAILSRNHTEAVFWGLELYDSNMESDAIQMLHTTWVSRLGFGTGSWFRFIQIQGTGKHVDRDDWCKLIVSLCRASLHDTTAFYLLIRGASTAYTWQPAFAHSKEYLTLDVALDHTLRRGKLLEAWLLSRAVGATAQWSILVKIATEKGRHHAIKLLRNSLLLPIEQLAAAFVLVTLNQVAWAAAQLPTVITLPAELVQAIEGWDSTDSLRLRRAIKVKPEAIVYTCRRSSQSVSESNEHEIQGDLEINLVTSSYWQGVLKPYRKANSWKSDVLKEKFYDLFFIHDIPDEWSLADREKSHGRGLGKPDDHALKQFVHHTFQRSETLGLWDYDKTLDSLESLDFTQLYSTLQEQCLKAIRLPLCIITKTFELQLM